MSDFAYVGDPVTRTAFEIRKNPLLDDIRAVVQLLIEDRTMDFDDFAMEMSGLFPKLPKTEKPWPPVHRVQALYDYIVAYAIEPTFVPHCETLGERVMQSHPFVEVGTMYNHEPMHGVRYSYQPTTKFNLGMLGFGDGSPTLYETRYLSLKWAECTLNGVTRLVPGYLLPSRQYFCPLTFIGGERDLTPCLRVGPKTLLPANTDILRYYHTNV